MKPIFLLIAIIHPLIFSSANANELEAKPNWWYKLIYSCDVCVMVSGALEKDRIELSVDDRRFDVIKWRVTMDELLYFSLTSTATGIIDEKTQKVKNPSMEILERREKREIELREVDINTNARGIAILKFDDTPGVLGYRIAAFLPLTDLGLIKRAISEKSSKELELINRRSKIKGK